MRTPSSLLTAAWLLLLATISAGNTLNVKPTEPLSAIRDKLAADAGITAVIFAEGVYFGAPYFDYSQRCAVTDGRVEHVGNYGVEVGVGCSDLEISHNRITSAPAARVFYNTGRADRPCDEKPNAAIDFDGRGPQVRDAPFVADFNGDGRPDLAVFGYTNTGIGPYGPSAAYIWISPPMSTDTTQRR